MADLDLACRDCGERYRTRGDLPRQGSLRCRRCGAILWRAPAARLSDPRAFALTAAILLVLANTFPVFDVSIMGDQRSGVIANGAAALIAYGSGISAVGALVALIAVAIPVINIALIVAVLFYLWAGTGNRARTSRIVRVIWRAAVRLRPWSMLDVLLLAAVVAYTRLGQLADTAIGVGGYALAAFVVVQILIDQMLGRDRVWNAIDEPTKYVPPAGAPSILCLDCDLVVAAGLETGGTRRRCPRCGARLTARRPGSLATTAAFSIAGLILYFPANLFPVLSITRFGQTEAYTIMGGIRDLATAGLWPLALLVLLASIIVPALKLASLAWCLVATRWRSTRLLRQRTALHRFVRYIGRWSNIDVFVVALVVALVQFGFLATIEPGPGIASFAAVVVLTMIAADAFDPRLMWDAAIGGRR
ncbi:MAG: paraquat-inducible protein A [Stellaceae bacterium]